MDYSKPIGTQELRNNLVKSCRNFIKEQKEKWKKEGYDLPDEILLWRLRKVIQEDRKECLGMEEFVGPRKG